MREFRAIDPETGRYDNLMAQLMLNEAYDIEYGLYDHDNPENDHPFQSQLMFDQEKILEDSPMNDLFETYHIYQINKWFGLDLLQFINLPAVRFDQLIKIANKLAEKENQRIANAENQMKNMQAQLNQQLNSNQGVDQMMNRFSNI